MIYINKILPIIFSPLGLVIIFLCYGILRKKILPSIIALMLLILLSLPIFSGKLTKILEQNYTPVLPNTIETADAIVVLSGMVRSIKKDTLINYEFSDAVDRIIGGMKLLNLNKAQKIILTKGKLPWSIGLSEGEYLADFLKSQGISPSKILLTEIVQNTNDEAKAISKMLPNNKIILVTSAFHMPRAVIVFQNQDLNVI
ncbi:MAG: YdcF family protein, partial [Paracoccaceae bacterium]